MTGIVPLLNRFQLSQWHLFKQHLSWWHLFILEISQLLVTWFLYVLSLAKHPLHCCCMLKMTNADHFRTNFLKKVWIQTKVGEKMDQMGALDRNEFCMIWVFWHLSDGFWKGFLHPKIEKNKCVLTLKGRGGPNGPPGFKNLIFPEPEVRLTSNQAVNFSLSIVLRPI